MTITRTTCPYCGVGCGIKARLTGEREAAITGDPDHPANAGKLCSKGTHLGETIGLEGRLLHPEIDGQRVSWDQAIGHVADRFAATIAEHGPESVAFYVSGQLLTEDYYVANKMMKGFIGTANIDTNSRLCMASAVSAHVRAFGEDVVPCSYSDLDEANLIILVGSNTAWCHPVVWQRIEAARATRGTKLVVIDPRRTETAERADLHIPITPDGDVALFRNLLAHMRDQDLLDHGFLQESVSAPSGFWDGLSPCADGVDEDLRRAFIALFAAHPRTVTLFSQGVNQSTSGTDKANAIINLHLATGRIGKPGAGPFSITGQPNAMGGREVGGLASMLAAHMGFTDTERDRVQRFWKSPTLCTEPGLKAVEMFDAVADGRIKAIWIMATNPAVSMPDAGDVRAALAACPLVVVSDCIADTDTTRLAHVKLPALAWGEKDGTVTNSERTISRQRGFLPVPGDAKPDWWIIAQIAARMGWVDAFDYPNAASIFREYAAQTGFENEGSRILDISDRATITDGAYDQLEPFQWGGASPFSYGRYPTSDGKARLVPVHPAAERKTSDFPLRLNTGRYRDHWHTMTRTGLSPRLSQHRREPLLELHPEDAADASVGDGALARVEAAAGVSVYRVRVTDAQRPGEIFVPMHWTDQQSSGGRTGRLMGKDRDPLSGQPGFKNTPARIAALRPEWTGFLITRDPFRPNDAIAPWLLYHTQVRTRGGWLVELAGTGETSALLNLLPPGERIEAVDAARGSIRAAVLENGHMAAALFLTRDGSLPQRDWLIAQLDQAAARPVELLAGRASDPVPDRGPIVCICFDVGLHTIVETIAREALTSVEAIGAALSAGTNCGSCRPALAALLPGPLESTSPKAIYG
ncbi:molybdopterin-dependent oxidoreductase [Sphingobium subterraneum]|uniref:Assimilatory nitrate reductase catalytic subunit n=1 Tax=Sphingobium subterraneum TaxID=627688 RepID=A0A841J045_9SPHN|nr:assimilatory nitrate reductase catalytic subunit [Sphingobium subterraneum]